MKLLRIAMSHACISGLWSGSARAQAPPIDAALAGIMANPRTPHAIYALDIYDLDAHRALYTHNAQTFVTAASTTKLLTEGTTLNLLGPDFRWTTRVYRTGGVDSAGTLHGDIVLVGAGDPNLSQRVQPDGTLAFENEDHTYGGSPETKALAGDPLVVLRELAAQIRAAGITRVDGRVAVDASLFPESVEGGTGLTVSPIIVNDNAIDVTVTPGARPGDPVAIAVAPQTAYVTFVNHATTAAAGASATIDFSDDVTDAAGHHRVTITGAQPVGPRVLNAYPVANPRAFASIAFTQVLGDAGVYVEKAPSPAAPLTPASAPYADANLVAKHVSPPISEDVKITLKVSQNLHAHLMPYIWGVYGAHARNDVLTAGFAAGAAALTQGGLSLDGAAVGDGEGAAAFFTPEWMVHYLAWARGQPWFPWLYRGLPIMGVDGTLATIQTDSPARGKVFAKTGTDGSGNAIRADQLVSKGLAGFMTTRHGRHLAFAFYLDHIEGPASEDTGHVAGEILGSLATATYEQL
jgi:D-alanyl-D-alanine carboxypeptidase/D-alanyl-D-alanine-endopeptidase (penicillin-binding protein 4)